MMSTKKAPTGGNRIGAKQDGLRTHPVPKNNVADRKIEVNDFECQQD